MQLNNEKTCDQSQQSNHERAEDLKKNITYTNTELHKLVSNEQQFIERIKQLNRNAIKQMNNQSFDEAIVYLAEAERNLQYAASCGLSIDRTLIITTLKNLACGYQRLWQLATCFDYIEASILNLSIQNDDHDKLLKTQSIKDKASIEYDKLSKIANIKLKLAISYLQFSALSSQLGRHEEANKNVHKSLAQFKIIMEISHAYELLIKGKTSILLESIRGCLQFKGNEALCTKVIEARKGIQKIKQYVYFFSFDCTLIEKVSMGDIMQVRCTTVEEANEVEGITWFISQIGLTYMAIYISCCFFAIATEIRLTIPEQERLKLDHHHSLESAKLHHLHSIILASQFVLIQSNYLNHIIKSFKNNFGIDLLQDQFKTQSTSEKQSHIMANQVKQPKPKSQKMAFKAPIQEHRSDECTQVNLRQSFKNRNKIKIKKQINQFSSNIFEIKKISSKKNLFRQDSKSCKNKMLKNHIGQKSHKKNEKNNNQLTSSEFNQIHQIKATQKAKKNEELHQKIIQNEYYLNKLQHSSNKKKILSPSLSSRDRIKKKSEQFNSSRSQKFKQKIKYIKSSKRQ